MSAAIRVLFAQSQLVGDKVVFALESLRKIPAGADQLGVLTRALAGGPGQDELEHETAREIEPFFGVRAARFAAANVTPTVASAAQVPCGLPSTRPAAEEERERQLTEQQLLAVQVAG
jgi:hypothetical protein